MNVYVHIGLVLCVCVCSLTAAPLQKVGVKYRSRIEEPSSRDKVLLLQRKLADLQRNLQRLEGEEAQYDGMADNTDTGDIAAYLGQAVGINLSKVDEDKDIVDDTIDLEDVLAGIPDGDDKHTVDNHPVPDDRENIGLTPDEMQLLQMLNEKQTTKTNIDVLREFLEEHMTDRVTEDVNKDVLPKQEEQQLAKEITQLNSQVVQDDHITQKKNAEISSPVVKEDGVFVNRVFTESELGPVKVAGGDGFVVTENDNTDENDAWEDMIPDEETVELEEVEERLITDIQFALQHGITMDELLGDISDKERAALQREALALGQQLADTEQEIDRLG